MLRTRSSSARVTSTQRRTREQSNDRSLALTIEALLSNAPAGRLPSARPVDSHMPLENSVSDSGAYGTIHRFRLEGSEYLVDAQ
jgi:hypothetical protein